MCLVAELVLAELVEVGSARRARDVVAHPDVPSAITIAKRNTRWVGFMARSEGKVVRSGDRAPAPSSFVGM